MRIIIFLLALMLAVLLNIVFVGVHYGADRLVPVETVKQRVRAAVASDNIVPMEYPWKTVGFASPLNAIGLNHRADCIMSLMAMYRAANPVLNAVNPGYLRTVVDDQLCDVVKALADDNTSGIALQKRSHHYFWHGAKPVTQLLLTKFDYYQIYQLIRQLSYLGWALLLSAAVARSLYAGLAFTPLAGLAIVGSGLPYNGGIVFALPYLSALVLALTYVLVQSRKPGRNLPEVFYMVVAGSVQAFFFQLDGSMILLSALLIFAIYFMDRAGRSATGRARRLPGLMLVFYLSFVASLLLKQGFAGVFIGFEPAWTGWQARLSALFSDGANPANLMTLINQYALSIMGHGGLARQVQYAGLAAWLAAAVFAVLFSLVRRSARPVADLLVFGLIGLLTLARFALLQAPSPEMALFASRYWFVLIASGMSALVWLVASYRYREGEQAASSSAGSEQTEQSEPAMERTARKSTRVSIPGRLSPDPGAAETRPRHARPVEKTAAGVNAQPAFATPADTPAAPASQADAPANPRSASRKTPPASEQHADKALEEILSGPVPEADLLHPGAKTEVTKEPARLTVEIPEFLDES